MSFFEDMEKRLKGEKKPKEKPKPKPRKKVKVDRSAKPVEVEAPQIQIQAPMVLSPYREVTEANIVLAVWDGETGGVKASILGLVFGKHRLREVRKILRTLIERRILVRDRNGWIHVNPYYMKQVLEHYGIPYDDEEILPTQKEILRRMEPRKREELRNNPPQF